MTSNLKSRNDENNFNAKTKVKEQNELPNAAFEYGVGLHKNALNLNIQNIPRNSSLLRQTSYQDENINDTFRTDGITTPKIVINNTDNQQKKMTVKPNKNLNIQIDDEEIDDDEIIDSDENI